MRKVHVTVITPFAGEFEFLQDYLGKRLQKEGLEAVFEQIAFWDGDAGTLSRFGMLVVGNLPLDLAEKLLRAGKEYIYFAVNRSPDIHAVDLPPEEIRKVGYKMYKVKEVKLSPVEGGCSVC